MTFFNDLGHLTQGMLSTEAINPKTEGRFFQPPAIVQIPVLFGTEAARGFKLKLKVIKNTPFPQKRHRNQEPSIKILENLWHR